MLLFGIAFLSLGAASNMLAERFQLDNNSIGTLTALLPLGILAGSLVFGPIVDRFGYKWMLAGAALIVGGGLECIAFADEARLVQIGVALIGFGGGILNGATNALAADVSEGERGAKLNLLGVFFGLGALTMPSTIALLSRAFLLEQIIAGIGAVTLAPAAFCLLIQFPPPKQRPDSSPRVSRLIGDPVFLLAALALAIQSGMEGMSNDWMTRYFKHVTLSRQESTEWKTQLGLVSLTGAMMLTRLALSWLLKWFDSRAVLLAGLGVASLGELTLLNSDGYAAALCAALLIGGGLAATFPIVLSYIGDRFPQESGSAFSAIFTAAVIGNMVINKSFGYVAQSHGIEQYAKVMLGCLACSVLLLGGLISRLNRSSRPGEL
jgi:FHS family glucose/mannose:H+ symporter-like MFS transporter